MSMGHGLALGDHYGKQFLNVSTEDVKQSRHAEKSLTLRRGLKVHPQRSLTLLPELRRVDGELVQYYEEKISRLISTVDANNGFRHELLPMAMNGSSSAAKALKCAILALSAFHRHHHLHSGAALPYKTQALQYLSQSMSEDTASDEQVRAQVAASMMLCVYNVFDAEEGNWHLHLRGSRSLLHRYANMRGGQLDYNFLSTWFLYHEILGSFSQPLKHQYAGTSSLDLVKETCYDKTLVCPLTPDMTLDWAAVLMYEDLQIIGSLGCSIEIMEIIHYINLLRDAATNKRSGLVTPPITTSDLPSVMPTCEGLHNRLTNLKQSLPGDHLHHPSTHATKEKTKIKLTAELYRLAAIIYLRAVSCTTTESTAVNRPWLEFAFDVLAGLEVCTSPWPLFVIACESLTDEQRIAVMRALDRMHADRGIGNVLVLRGLIEDYWKQVDLQAEVERAGAGGGRGTLRWWELMNFDTAAPWFI